MSEPFPFPPTEVFTVEGRKLRGNIYYPDEDIKITLGERKGDNSLLNFRLALLKPTRMTMQGTTAQRVCEGILSIKDFLSSLVTKFLDGKIPDSEVKEIATRFSTRGQISAFGLAFDLNGLIGVEAEETSMPLDTRDILGLLYTVDYYGHRGQIQSGLHSLLEIAIAETLWEEGPSDSEGEDNKSTLYIDRTAEDIPTNIWLTCPPLGHFLRGRGLKIEMLGAKKEGADSGENGFFSVLKIESIGKGMRKWRLSESGPTLARAHFLTCHAALLALQAAYNDPAVY
ncbi:hypothetical protein TWF718_003471 [Orbilia javanica]|uniref:Uncharacterized protein n=1 Tax=Orbilia javanica TaxID=47235 RepID=A0AAN8R7X9_9PEZI